jgi:hypothetical protein
MLTQIAACEELFHTAPGTAFANLLVDGHRETWPIRSKRFRGWLRRRYYEATGGALTRQAISSELDLLEARRNLSLLSAPSMSASPRMRIASILISPTITGVPSKSDARAGG